jgi:circadian clock protein KaiC
MGNSKIQGGTGRKADEGGLSSKPQFEKIETGISGLDNILRGGLPRNRFFLIEGDPGAGKTTLALDFLLRGAAAGERGLYITLSETRDELEEIATSHGWDLSAISIFELSAIEHELNEDEQTTLFYPSEVELGRTTRVLLDEVERVQPVRVVFDSLSEMRLLAQQPLRYRKQMLALKQYFAGRKITVVLLDDRTLNGADREIQSLVHGVISLERWSPAYGAERRRLAVQKMRGVPFRGGFHDYVIRKGGLRIFPRLVAAEHAHDSLSEIIKDEISSGVRELDSLLGGGIDRGTSTLVLGPPGTGKSTIAIQYAVAAAEQGKAASLYCFDENRATILSRARDLGLALAKHLTSGLVSIRQVDPAELTPGEFAEQIQQDVEKRGVKLVVIDSLNGYTNAMPEENFLNLQLHEMLSYLGHQGVASILVLAQQGLIGSMNAPVDVTYLADTVLMLRYFESKGAFKQAISVIKKRSGDHERTIREFWIGRGGIKVGAPLSDFHGVLTGVPVFSGAQSLLSQQDDHPTSDLLSRTDGQRSDHSKLSAHRRTE